MKVTLSHVTKVYGDVIGVNDIDLDLAPGAYGLLGPNGSGKSTLLNLVTGQLRPTLGRVTIDGRAPWNCRETRRRLGFCPEADVLYPQTTGFEFVRYLLRLHGYDARSAAATARQALASVGMEKDMDRPIRGYSRGMRQRTKLAQALAHEPPFLVLDEPLNGLDPEGRHTITERLRRYAAEGRTLIMASHVLHEVQAVTDRFILIRFGRVLADGSVDEIRELLADIPHTATLVCDRPADLGRLLLDGDVVEGVGVDAAARDRLRISTRRPRDFYRALPGLLAGSDLVVREMSSPEDSLETLFDYLMNRF